MAKQHKIIDRETWTDPRPIREIELDVLNRLATMVGGNSLGWKPYGRDGEGHAIIGCVVRGPLTEDGKKTERVCRQRITVHGLEIMKEEIRVVTD